MLRNLTIVVAGIAVTVAAVLYLRLGPLTTISEEMSARRSAEEAAAAERVAARLPSVEHTRMPAPRPSGPTHRGRLEVRVFATDGSPIAGAAVFGDDTGSRHRTDDEGQVTFDEPPALLRVSHPDFAPACSWLTDADVEDGEHRVTMLPAGELRCRVVDESGAAVPGAEVVLTCGSADPGGDEEPAGGAWQASLVPAVGDQVLYVRRGRSDGDGAVTFRGLAAGIHQVFARSEGHVTLSRLAGEWTRAIDVVAVHPGENSARLEVQSLYVQVAVIRNETNLPQDTFDPLLLMRARYAFELTDLLPSMERAAQTTRRRIAAALRSETGREKVYVGVARARMPAHKVQPTAVSVLFRGRFADEVAPRWVRADEFRAEDAAEVVVREQLETGSLCVHAPYSMKAHPVVNGRSRRFGFVFHPGDAPKTVPAGEYLVAPISEHMLWQRSRARRVTVAPDGSETLSFDDAMPIANLRVEVVDAAGRPTDRCEVQVESDKLFQSIRPTGGVVERVAEPGTYLVWVRDLSLTTVFNQEVPLLAGEERRIEVALPR